MWVLKFGIWNKVLCSMAIFVHWVFVWRLFSKTPTNAQTMCIRMQWKFVCRLMRFILFESIALELQFQTNIFSTKRICFSFNWMFLWRFCLIFGACLFVLDIFPSIRNYTKRTNKQNYFKALVSIQILKLFEFVESKSP